MSKKYKTLVVDPSWDVKHGRRTPTGIYGTRYTRPNFELMSNEDLLLFPIDKFAAEESHIYLWAINSSLRFVFEILEAWNFKFHCVLVWNKNIGFRPQVFYFRNEFILFGYRGKLTYYTGGCIPTHFLAKTREVVRKPDELYQIAEQVSLPPRIDIFSREKRKGWDNWGDEVEKFE